MTVLDRLPVLLALIVAIAAGLAFSRRRIVFVWGRQGRLVAPGFCLVVWLIGVALGERLGSLLMMATTGAVFLVALALLARQHRPIRLRSRRLTPADTALLFAMAAYLVVVAGFDPTCHTAVVSAYLRGNVPPSALNDPGAPLVYHALFDAVAALFTRALGVDIELGLDLASILAVAAALLGAMALARHLFPRSRLAQLTAPLCLAFGFGPTYFRLLAASSAVDVYDLHGYTNQAFLEQILRRPAPLAFAVVLVILVTLAALTRRAARPSVELTASLLVPPILLLPLIAEEQLLIVGSIVAVLTLRRRLPLAGAAVLAGAALLGAAFSGVFRSLFVPATMATPRLGLQWPPLLPSWRDPFGGPPVVSWPAGATVLLEMGPFLLLAIALLLRHRTVVHRMVLAVIGLDLAAALFLRLEGWPRADLDRLVFHASNLALVSVPALWNLRPVRSASPGVRTAIVLATLVVLAGGSVPSAAHRFFTQAVSFRTIYPERPYAQIRRTLAPLVGPRELILTDLGSAQFLVEAGFVVLAPMDSHMIGVINKPRFAAYVRQQRCRADWLWLPEEDPAIARHEVVETLGGYALVRNPVRCVSAAPPP